MTETKELSAAAAFTEKGIQIADLRDAYQFAKYVVASRLAPSGLDTPEKVLVAVQTGMEAGLKPMSALRSVYVVNGAPAWRGDAALGLIRASGLLKDFARRWDGKGDDEACTVVMERKGGGSVTETFSIQDAKDAGLLPAKDGSPWKKYRRRMLYYRALGFAARDLFSDVLGNLHIAEEVMDERTAAKPRAEIDVTPPAAQKGEPDPLFDKVAKTPELLPPEKVEPAEPSSSVATGVDRGVEPSPAEQALGAQDVETGPNSLGQLDDTPADEVSGPKVAKLTPKPKRRSDPALRTVLTSAKHPVTDKTYRRWSKNQKFAAWEWAWEELWFLESVDQEADDQSPNPLPRPSFLPEYGDMPPPPASDAQEQAGLEFDQAVNEGPTADDPPAPGGETPPATTAPPGGDCGKVLDLEGAACGLMESHYGPCEPK